uniref:Uncharacterized protein n=1 Tax=Tetranychus urticae TaxID=32264 RepID=T1JPW3_TETUR
MQIFHNKMFINLVVVSSRHLNSLIWKNRKSYFGAEMFLLKKLFTLLCIIVCSYQLYFTTIDYLEFNVITLLDIDFPDWLTVPDITLCVQFLDAVNWTAWAIRHPDLLPDNCSIIDDDKERSEHIRECFAEMGADDFEGFVQEHFTVAKFYKLVIKAQSLFDLISFDSKTGSFNGLQKNHDIFCTTRTYLRDPHVCYHLACRNGTNPSDDIRFHRSRLIHSPNPGAMFMFRLYNAFFASCDHVFLYIHSPLDLPRGPLESYLVIKPKEKPSLFLISFILIIDNLLEPPYATNCKDYHHDDEGTQSLIHKYEECLNNQTLKLDPSFVMYQTMIENPQKVEGNFSNRLRYKYKDKLNEIRTECGKLVEQPQCKVFIYIPYIIGHERFVSQREYHSNFIIMAPTTPDIKLEKSPVFLLETYVVNIGSILGIWFGFSMVHHLGSLGSHLLKLKNISKFSWNNICLRHEKPLKKSVYLNCEQKNQKQNTAERPAIAYYRTHGLLSRARAAIAESRKISESRCSQSIRSRYVTDIM